MSAQLAYTAPYMLARRTTSPRLLLTLGVELSFLLLACTPKAQEAARRARVDPAAEQRKEIDPAKRPPSAERRELAREAKPKVGAGAAPKTPGADAGAPRSAAQVCPSDMQLVAGKYCSEVKQVCAKSWYDRANRKTVCERFKPPSECVGTRTPKRFCIDRYEWPNRAGERPEVMNTFYQAQVKCAAVGKRLCTESEWTFACEGPEMKPYPYGYGRDANICNGDRRWGDPDMNKVARRDATELARLWQGRRSGSQPECVSDFGVYDLPGNVDEVAASENDSATWRGKYDSVTTGGPWYRGVRNQCRPKIYTHSEGFYYYYLGFRCCSEPDGKPTDPRTPKQIARGMSFGHIERLARFGAEEMREKLKLEAEGRCSCGPRDTLCKTMCGTLLGPDARDAPPAPTPSAKEH